MESALLNKKFGIENKLTFKSIANGMTFMEVNTDQATASLSLMGGQVLTWHPKFQVQPVFWLSKLAHYLPGKAIRGGAPVCWPWFGSHSIDNGLPGHGYARLVPWKVISTSMDAAGVVDIELKLEESNEEVSLRPIFWPKSVSLTAKFRIGEQLEISLTTKNLTNNIITLTEGLHTYFNISDIRNIKISGLEDSLYVDLTDNNELHNQTGPILFNQEVGRIFLDCKKTTVIEDTAYSREIFILGSGSKSIAVWNPWFEKASKISDIGSYGYLHMVCVETANALRNKVDIKTNESHTISARYIVRSSA